MKNGLTKRFWITALIVAVLVAITLSATIVSAIAKNVAAQPRSVEESALATPDNKGDKMINERIYATTHNRSRWLYDLITVSGKATLTDSGDAKKIFEAARNCGVISDYTEEDMVLPLTRFFVAQTTVRALNYKQRTPGHIADINSLQSAMATMAYYGYFLPDVNNMVYPDREITAEEYEGLLTQLERYRQLKGKVIADMIAEKYGMTAHDYSVPGAAMGLWVGRSHIIDQLRPALNDLIKPDIILINGGTNDMNHVSLGDFTEGYDMTNTSSENFTGGFEKTMWMLTNNYYRVPVVYVRAHNMDLGSDANERKFGERALDVVEKWNGTSVDIYKDTDLYTEDSYMRCRYTYFDPAFGNAPDSIHPNALGYATYYLPLVTDEIMNQLIKE